LSGSLATEMLVRVAIGVCRFVHMYNSVYVLVFADIEVMSWQVWLHIERSYKAYREDHQKLT
jgi:hypothetical protein